MHGSKPEVGSEICVLLCTPRPSGCLNAKCTQDGQSLYFQLLKCVQAVVAMGVALMALMSLCVCMIHWSCLSRMSLLPHLDGSLPSLQPAWVPATSTLVQFIFSASGSAGHACIISLESSHNFSAYFQGQGK